MVALHFQHQLLLLDVREQQQQQHAVNKKGFFFHSRLEIEELQEF